MRDDPTRFVGSIPEHYDQGMGPVIFVRPADLVAMRVASFEPARVLETAAGTGILTRRLRDLLPGAVPIVATDLNPAMLDVSRRKFRPGEAVTLEPADATALHFADGKFDAIVCQFGVMFFPDKEKAYREASRVFAPGGRYVFSVWDTVDHNPFARIIDAALRSAFATDPPPFLDVPFGYAALDPIKTSLLTNGFAGLRIGRPDRGRDRGFRRLRQRTGPRQPAHRPDPGARRRARKAGRRGEANAARRIQRRLGAAPVHRIRSLARVKRQARGE
jgi:SAM-dependent methyltransferase